MTKTNQELFQAIQTELEGLHRYNCGSDEHRADLHKDYGLPQRPARFTELSRKQGYLTPQEQKIVDEGNEVCWAEADADSDNTYDSAGAIAYRVLELLRGSVCDHCGERHSDPDTTYGFAFGHLLMHLIEMSASDLIERGEMWSKSDILKYIMAIEPSKQAA